MSTGRISPKAGDRVRIIPSPDAAMLGGMEGEIVEFLDDGYIHVRVDPYKETAWLGGRDYGVPSDMLRLIVQA